MNRLLSRALVVTTALVLTATAVAPASADTAFGVTLDRSTNLTASGDTINVTLANTPAGQGLYVRLCVEPSTFGTRPTLCNGQGVWVTATVPAGTPGTAVPGSVVALPVVAAFTSGTTAVDCTKTQCGVFVRRDHFGPTDQSLDKWVPVTFVGDAIARPGDTIKATVDGKEVVAGRVFTLRYRTPVQFTPLPLSGQVATIASLSANCVVDGTTVTAVRGSGDCALSVRTAGNASFSATQAIFPITLAPAQQVIAIPSGVTTAKAGTTVTIAPASLTSSLGQKVTWKSASSGCTLTTAGGQVRLTAKSARTCVVNATAPARAGLWNAATAKVQVRFTK